MNFPLDQLTATERTFMTREHTLVKRATRPVSLLPIASAILITLFLAAFIADHVLHLTDVAYSPNSNASYCLQAKHLHTPVHGATPAELTSLCAQYN